MSRSSLSAAAVALGFALLAALPPTPAAAVDATDLVRVDVPFGGIILSATPCLNGPLHLVVFDLRTLVPLPILLQPWSRLNAYFAPFPGNAAVGTFLPIPDACVVSVTPTGAVILPALGSVSAFPLAGMGTSLLPPPPGGIGLPLL